MSPTIDAIVFDAVGTLIHPQPAAPEVYASVGRCYGSSRTSAEIAERFVTAFQCEEARDRNCLGLRTSEAREHERWQTIVAGVLDDAVDPASCFDELFTHFSKPEHWRVTPEAVPTLQQLAARGFRLGLASNYDRRLRSVLAGLPDLDILRTVAISSETGWRKPAPEFYARLCQDLDLPPDRVLLVGDDFHNDYEGARTAGLQAVLFDPRRRVPHVQRIDRLGELLLW